MSKFRYYFLLFSLNFIVFTLHGQVDDNILWASFKLNKKITPNTSWSLAPIIRYYEDISTYQNISVDVSLRHKLSSSMHAQILSRTWSIPNGTNRQFIWLDMNYSTSINRLKISNNLRYHYAIDIGERKDPDYIRWKATLSVPGIRKFEPLFSIEPWLRMNGFTELQRIRFEPGVSIDFQDNAKFIFVFRRERSLNIEPINVLNVYVVTLSYTI